MSNRKPPLHPSRHQYFKNSTTAPVHNSNNNNNRLANNTIFQNNQYTFSLSRISGNYSGVGLSPNGYIEPRPLSSASIHGEGSFRLTNRGTKSDIGVPIRRQSNKKNFFNGSNIIKKTPSVNSELISYISNNNNSNNNASNNLQCTNNSTYFITGGYNNTPTTTTTKTSTKSKDYLENYKASTKLYNMQIQNLNSSNSISSNLVGPLVYLESDNNNLNNRQSNNKYYQSLKNVST